MEENRDFFLKDNSGSKVWELGEEGTQRKVEARRQSWICAHGGECQRQVLCGGLAKGPGAEPPSGA